MNEGPFKVAAAGTGLGSHRFLLGRAVRFDGALEGGWLLPFRGAQQRSKWAGVDTACEERGWTWGAMPGSPGRSCSLCGKLLYETPLPGPLLGSWAEWGWAGLGGAG